MNNGVTIPTPRGFGAVPDVDIPTPTPPEAPEAPPAPFPVHCLPPVAHAMVEAVCAAVRVPASLAGPAALGILSGSIGAGLEVESGPGRRSRGNLYLIPSAESGSGKSEALRYFSAAFLAYEQAAVEAHRRDTLPGILADVDLLNVEVHKLLKAARTDDLTAADRESIRARLQEKKAVLAEAEARLQAPVLTVENVTTEALAVLLSRRGETLFSFSGDARGLLDNLLGRYTKGERTDESLYLKGWTGDPERVDRMGRASVSLTRPCLAALWLVQPDKVENLLATPALIDGGLLPRFLLCHTGCEPQEMTEDSASAAGVPSEVAEAWADTVRALLEHWRGREGEPATVRPTGAARALFREHFNASVRRWHAGELRDVNSFRARWTEQGWRIALCLHAATWGADAAARALTEETAEAALTIADWFSDQQLAILARGRTERRLTRLESLCTKLAGRGGSATLRDLEKSNGFDPAEVRALALAFPGRVRVEQRTAGIKGGRPSETAVLPAGLLNSRNPL